MTFLFSLPSFFLETLQKSQEHEIAPELHESNHQHETKINRDIG
jgi:hypothetical protein